MRIVAVVVNWNGGESNLRCLDSLAEQGEVLERVLFVDNASSDGSRELVARSRPQVEVLDAGANFGYGGGNNLGFARALELGADAVLVVNNDVTFERGAVARLAAALEREPRVGVVGPRVLMSDRPELVWAAGGELTWCQNLTTLRGFGARDGDEWRRELEVDYVAGCALLVRREVLEALGGFDDSYFAYTEDVDFGLRARRAGWSSRIVGSAAAYHAPSSSTGGGYNPRRKYMMGLNSVRFLREWGGVRAWLRFVAYDVLTLPPLLVAGLFRGQAKAVLAKAWGIVDGLRGKRITARTVEPGSHWLW